MRRICHRAGPARCRGGRRLEATTGEHAPETGVLRVRTSRRPSEPDPVSTGEGSHMRSVRALAARCALTALGLTATACSAMAARRQPRQPSGDAGKQVVLVTHDSFVLPKQLIRQFEQRVRLPPGRPGLRRRRHADQQAGADQGRPDRRRRLRRRQHLRLAGPRRGRLRAVRRRRCRPAPAATRCPATTAPPHPGRQRQRLRQRRHHLVRRPPPRAAAAPSTT